MCLRGVPMKFLVWIQIFFCHHLNVNPSITPKKQPPRRSSKKHFDAVKEEVIKLKRVGAIKEVFYPE